MFLNCRMEKTGYLQVERWGWELIDRQQFVKWNLGHAQVGLHGSAVDISLCPFRLPPFPSQVFYVIFFITSTVCWQLMPEQHHQILMISRCKSCHKPYRSTGEDVIAFSISQEAGNGRSLLPRFEMSQVTRLYATGFLKRMRSGQHFYPTINPCRSPPAGKLWSRELWYLAQIDKHGLNPGCQNTSGK